MVMLAQVSFCLLADDVLRSITEELPLLECLLYVGIGRTVGAEKRKWRSITLSAYATSYISWVDSQGRSRARRFGRLKGIQGTLSYRLGASCTAQWGAAERCATAPDERSAMGHWSATDCRGQYRTAAPVRDLERLLARSWWQVSLPIRHKPANDSPMAAAMPHPLRPVLVDEGLRVQGLRDVTMTAVPSVPEPALSKEVLLATTGIRTPDVPALIDFFLHVPDLRSRLRPTARLPSAVFHRQLRGCLPITPAPRTRFATP